MGRIESKDIVQPDVLKPLRDEMDLTIAKAQKLSDGLVIVMKQQSKVANETKKSAQGYKELAAAEEKSKKALLEHQKLEEKILKLKTQEARLNNELNKALLNESKRRQENAKALQQEQKARQQKIRTQTLERKESERQAKITKQQNSAYFQLTKTIDRLTAEYRDLVVAEGKETQQSRKMRDEILKLNAIRDKSNNALGMHQNKVGQYERALNGLNRTLGQLGIAFGVFQLLRNTFGIISASEDAFASLSAITGLTGEKFDAFKGAIMETANELKVSGTVVAEAAEKIASAQPALLEDADALAAVTAEAITLNKAIKGDLTETSMALVGVMNQFSLGAEEASRVINILAAGSQAGAATVTQINESMVKFGTTAKLMNISVEESVGLIETLGEKAIFGSDAGTALRNILLKMGAIDVLPPKALAQLEKYGVNTAIVKDETLSLEERLKELSKIAGDSTAIMQVFGMENATAATVLLNNLGTYDKMTAAVTGTNVAQEQAAINSDTLSGVLGELRAAWENLVIKWSEGTNVAGGLKAVLRFIAENLETIIEWVLKAVTAWASYRLTLLAWNKEGTGVIQNLIRMGQNLVKSVQGVKGLSGAMKGLGNAMKSIPLAGWVAILTTLIPLIWDFVSGLFEAESATFAVDKATATLNERMIDEKAKLGAVFEQLKHTNAGSQERADLIDYINSTYGTTLQNLDDESQFALEVADAYAEINKQLEKKIRAEVAQEQITELIREQVKLQQELDKIKKRSGGIENEWDILAEDINEGRAEVIADRLTWIQTQIDDLFGFMNEVGAEELGGIGKLNLGVKELGDEVETSGAKLDTSSKKINQYAESIDKATKAVQQFNDTTLSPIKGKKTEKIDNAPKENEGFWMSDMMISFYDDMKKKQVDWVESIRESISSTLTMISEMMEANSSMLDEQIAKQNQMLDSSINKEQELRDIARERGLDASESIDAEREAQKKARREIEALEQKKRNLEMMIAAMKLLADGKSLGEIKENLGQIKSFVEGSFYEGTPYTLADALGRTGTRDGHVVRVDDNEAIFNPQQTAALGIGKGGNSTQDIVDIFKSFTRPEMKVMRPSIQDNGIIARKLDALIEATTTIPDAMPRYDSVFNSQVGYMEWAVRSKNKSIKRRYYTR